MIYAVSIHIVCFVNFIFGNEGGSLIMNVLWRSLARMSAKLIFLLSVAGCFGTLAYAGDGIVTTSVNLYKSSKIDAIPVSQSNNEFCTSGSVNINNVSMSCSNGNCNSTGIKITCNEQSCQWCDANDNCGNILYNGVLSITGGSINCNNGQCSYSTQSRGSSSGGNFSCKNGTTQSTAKVELVNPIISQKIYQDGDSVKITIPQTLLTGQSQYFGVGLPNDLGLFVAGSQNEFQPFDASNLPEWYGGETAVDIPVTPDLPRGTYNAYLLRSLKGIDPLKAKANQTALGTANFVVMDEIKVTQITDPNTELAFIGTTGKETIGILGVKDKNGRLTKVNRICFGSQTNPKQNLSITLNNNYLPKTIEFPDSSQIEFSNYTDKGATATYRNSGGNVTSQVIIPLRMNDLYAAAAAIKQFQDLPQPTQNNSIPSRESSTNFPTGSDCLEVMAAVYKGLDSLFWGLLQIASVTSCQIAATTAFSTVGTAIPLAIWVCGSVMLNGMDKIAEVATGGKSPLKKFNQGNDLVQGVSSCIAMRDLAGCAQFVASKVIDGTLDQLKPENVCKGDGAEEPKLMEGHGIANRCHGILNNSHKIANLCSDGPYSTGWVDGYDSHNDNRQVVINVDNDGSFEIHTYEHGLRNGISGVWKADCSPMGWHGNYVNDEQDGVWTYVSDDGSYFAQDTYIHGIKSGYSGKWDVNGNPIGFHGNYYNYDRNGIWTELYNNGRFRIETYVSGMLHGYTGQWEADCSPIGSHGNYVNGKQHGVWTVIGGQWGSRDAYSTMTYDNGVLNGFSGVWETNGTPVGWHGNYVNGQVRGVWTYYCSNGSNITFTHNYIYGFGEETQGSCVIDSTE